MSFQMTVFAEGVERQRFYKMPVVTQAYKRCVRMMIKKRTVFKEVRKGCIIICVPFLMYSPKCKACSISAGSVSPRFSKPRTDLL